MSSHGWSNDSTWGVAGAADNTWSFHDTRNAIVDVAGRGLIGSAAEQLRESVADQNLLHDTLPSWVDINEVDWRELVQSWAQDAT